MVGTQTDLRDDPQVRDKLAKQKMQPVRREDGEKMAKELGAVKYVECSALTQFKLKDVFDEVSLTYVAFDAAIADSHRQSWPRSNHRQSRSPNAEVVAAYYFSGQASSLRSEHDPGVAGHSEAWRKRRVRPTGTNRLSSIRYCDYQMRFNVLIVFPRTFQCYAMCTRSVLGKRCVPSVLVSHMHHGIHGSPLP